MVINFKNIDLLDRPTLVLRNLDGTAIQTLGYAFHFSASIKYNEVSSIEFDYPEFVDGTRTPNYDNLVGMRIVDWVGVAQFILINPSIRDDGVSKIKSCKAYSLEYEFTFKKLSLDNSTYNFYNPIDLTDTIIGIILEKMPSWSVGTIDEQLIGKYRTFEVSDSNVYNFIKETVQDSYECIIDFDTTHRLINARSTNSVPASTQVFLSTNNLIKEISIDEDSEGIFTCLDVNGAEGVNIRSVNPLGTNKIYNLDYFMTPANFSEEMILKWESWKQSYADAQMPFYILSIDSDLQISRIDTESAKLTDLEGELTAIDTTRSTYIQYLAQYPNDEKAQANLDQCNEAYEKKETEIALQKEVVADAENKLDDITNQITTLRDSVSFAHFFTDEELVVLDRYFKEDAISESSFVAATSTSYASPGTSYTASGLQITIDNAKITAFDDATKTKKIYSITGGSLSFRNDEIQVTAEVVSSAFENYHDGSYIFSAYLKNCKSGDELFPTACISATGKVSNVVTDCEPDDELHGDQELGTKLSFTHESGNLYLTKQVTQYAQHSIEFDLFEYGQDVLSKLSQPTYTFSVDAANFLRIDEFIRFKNQLILGERIYLKLDSRVLQPILIGVDFAMDDVGGFTLTFSDKFNSSDSAFQLVDLLEQSISMGKSVDFSKYTYREFVDSGANSSVADFMNSALDVAKNMVVSADKDGRQNMVWNEAGINLSRIEDDGSVSKNQLRIINNNIVFTDDSWKTAKMAIGQFHDENTGDVWGVVAPSIVGTILAGENLIIESKKQDGGIAEFRVDASGAKLYNSKFDLVSQYSDQTGSFVGQIGMIPNIGIVAGTGKDAGSLYAYDEHNGEVIGVKINGGTDYITSLEDLGSNDSPVPNFWVDMHGSVFLRGTVYATDGQFSGIVQAKDFLDANGNSMMTNGKFDSNYLDLGNIQLDGNTGDITLTGNINLSEGHITWGNNSPVQYQFSVDGISGWHSTMSSNDKFRRDSTDGGVSWGPAYQFRGEDGQDGRPGSDANVPRYIQSTYIDETEIRSPTIYAGKFYATNGSNIYAQMDNEGFAIYDTTVTEPKAQLASMDNGNAIWFSLGAGSGTTVLDDRFVVLKTPSFTSMLLYGDNTCGFTFRSNGTIEVTGDLDVGNVVAVFG